VEESKKVDSPRRMVRNQAGFTLLELGLVVLIIGVMLTITVPRIGDTGRAELVSTARKLAATFRYLRHAAILDGRNYQLVWDLDAQQYYAAVEDLESGFKLDEEGPVGQVQLEDPIVLSDVDLPLLSGKVQEGVVYTTFYPDGYVDLTVVHLDNGQDVYTLYVSNEYTGRVSVLPGYLEY
jgi:type II secretory pathway pseudopilin PulG